MGDVPADRDRAGPAWHGRRHARPERPAGARRAAGRGSLRGHRRRGAERAAHPAANRAPPPQHRQPDRACRPPGHRRQRGVRARDRHARGAGPPRRSPDGAPVRPDAAAAAIRAGAAAVRAVQDTPAAVVDRPGRATVHDRRGSPPPPRPGARRSGDRRPRCRAGGRRVAQQDRRGRQRQPLGRGRAARAGRAAARAAIARPARAAGLLRSRGDAPGRGARVPRSPPPRTCAGAHVVRQPRHGRLAASGDARGGGPGLDGGVRRSVVTRPARRVCASALEIRLERGFRARASTDSVIPSRAGYPIATLVSITDWRSPANYHLPSDIPENLDYDTVADATRLVYELARALAEGRHGDFGA